MTVQVKPRKVFLKNKLEELGQDVLFTREPGGVKGAEEIRNLLVQGKKIVGQILLKFTFCLKKASFGKSTTSAINKEKL